MITAEALCHQAVDYLNRGAQNGTWQDRVDAVKRLLREFGVARVSHVPPNRRDEFSRRLKDL